MSAQRHEILYLPNDLAILFLFGFIRDLNIYIHKQIIIRLLATLLTKDWNCLFKTRIVQLKFLNPYQEGKKVRYKLRFISLSTHRSEAVPLGVSGCWFCILGKKTELQMSPFNFGKLHYIA